MALHSLNHTGGIDMIFAQQDAECLPRRAGDSSLLTRVIEARLESRHGAALAQSQRRY